MITKKQLEERVRCLEIDVRHIKNELYEQSITNMYGNTSPTILGNVLALLKNTGLEPSVVSEQVVLTKKEKK